MSRFTTYPPEPQIIADRARYKIPEVHRGCMPKPMADHIRRQMRAEGFRFQWWQRTTVELLCILHQQFDALFDHVGQSVTADGRPCFCCEPYRQVPEIHEEASRFAKRFGLRLHLAEHSWHFPGETVRFEFTLDGSGD